jgi:peptide/nickel transport system substrate-binding protein
MTMPSIAAFFASGRRRRLLHAAGALATCLFFAIPPAGAQTLRVAMTASDLPTLGGIPDNGAEGYRFTGYTVYDALVNWDFTHTDKIAGLTPGLATEWKVDEQDTHKWVFTLRKGVKFQDGTDFNADAVIFNIERSFNDKAPQFDTGLAAIVRSSLSIIDRWQKIDDDHVAFWTKIPYSPFPYLMTRLLIASPTQFAKVGSWAKFMLEPIGTGPFKVTHVTPHVSIEMVRNEDYWDKGRVPKLAKMILFPMPEPTTRLAALRSGQVDWIEVPPPDSIPSLKAAGFQITLKPYPHVWPWILSESGTSPFKDKNVRLAANYAIDREGLVKLLNGTAQPARGFLDPDHPDFGNPHEVFKYDPDKAKALLKASGYGPDHPAKAKIMMSSSGSGQMVPVEMNEFLQQNLKAVGIAIEFDVADWGTLLVATRGPPEGPMSHGDDGVNSSIPYSDVTFLYRFFDTAMVPPAGSNWAHFSNPEADKALEQAFSTFDEAARDKLLGEAHAHIVDDAAWLFVVHDLNPRAMSSKVTGFIPAQSWYQDFTQVTVK